MEISLYCVCWKVLMKPRFSDYKQVASKIFYFSEFIKMEGMDNDIYKDAAGKTIDGGKYIAVFEKRGGKWLCLREIIMRTVNNFYKGATGGCPFTFI